MSRILIFTGKGGVGKTSIAAAHARKSSLEGKRTLIVSTDMAHNLADLFQRPLKKEPVEVAENLFALEIDPGYMMDHEFKDMKEAIVQMMSTSIVPMPGLSQLSILPGMDELFSLLKILELYEGGAFERIIVDCAPTGETLALLKFPELLSWYMEKFLPVGKVALRVLSPLSKAIYKIDLPNKEAISDIERLFMRLVALQELLKNRELTSVRIVAMPEKMVLEETKRNYMYMNLFNFHVDGLYINRILPRDLQNDFFDQWIDIQQAYIETYEMVFGEIPIYKIPWFDTDLNGLAGLDQMVDRALSIGTLFDLHADFNNECYEKTAEGYLLKMKLPFAQKAEIDLCESLTDIIIKIGNFKRSISKPSVLRNCEIAGATLEEGILAIRFAEK